jgi:hypothetical protein
VCTVVIWYISSGTLKLCVGDVEDPCKKSKAKTFHYGVRVTSFPCFMNFFAVLHHKVRKVMVALEQATKAQKGGGDA